MSTRQPSNNLALQAENLKMSGNLSAALVSYRNAVALHPKDATLRHNYAAALCDAGQFAETIVQIEAAFALGLDAPETWLVYARALQGTLQIDAAIDAFDQLLKKRHDDADAHRDRAQLVWMQTGDPASALNLIEAAIARFPDNENLTLSRAAIMGQVLGAEYEYNELAAIIKTSGSTPNLELLASRAALQSHQSRRAVTHAEKIWMSHPDLPESKHALCRALIADGDAQSALEFAFMLCKETPGHQGYLALLLTCWRLLGDEQYTQICDYTKLVKQLEFCCPKGWQSSTAYCEDLASVLDGLHPFRAHPFDLSVQGGSQISSIETREEPVFRAFNAACQDSINQYKDELCMDGDFQRSLKKCTLRPHAAWSVKLFEEGFHKSHIHPQGFVSSALHLNVVNASISDQKAGWMKFGEPGLPTKPSLGAEYYVKPRPGHIVVFPSFIWHGTVPFSSNDERITVAVDFTCVHSK